MTNEDRTDPWRKPVGKKQVDDDGIDTLAEEAAAPEPSLGSLVLAVESGAEPATFDLKPGMSFTIGRRSTMQTGAEHVAAVVERDASDSIIIRGNPHVSTHHVALSVTAEGSVFVTDQGSLNGSFIGTLQNRLTPKQPVTLRPGEKLILCRQAQITFVLREET